MSPERAIYLLIFVVVLIVIILLLFRLVDEADAYMAWLNRNTA